MINKIYEVLPTAKLGWLDFNGNNKKDPNEAISDSNKNNKYEAKEVLDFVVNNSNIITNSTVIESIKEVLEKDTSPLGEAARKIYLDKIAGVKACKKLSDLATSLLVLCKKRVEQRDNLNKKGYLIVDNAISLLLDNLFCQHKAISCKTVSGKMYAFEKVFLVDDNGLVVSGCISQDEVEGVDTRSQWLWFNAEGTEKKVVLSADQKIGGIIFPKGAKFVFPQNNYGDVIVELPGGSTIKANGIELKSQVVFDKKMSLIKGILVNKGTFDKCCYEAGTEIKFDNGKVIEGYLAENVSIDGVTYRKGFALGRNQGVYRNNVLNGVLAKDYTANGVTFSAGSYVGKSAFFDYLATKGLYEIGKLKYNTTIGGIEFRAGEYISFYSEGKVKTGILQKDAKIQGIWYAAGTEIFFNAFGKITTGTLLADTKIKDILYKAKTVIEYNDNQSSEEETPEVLRGFIKNDTKIAGVLLKAGTEIHFADGKGFMGFLAQDTKVDGIELKGETGVVIREESELVSGTLLKDTIVGKYVLMRGKEFRLFNASQPMWCTIAKEIVINEQKYYPGDYLEFDLEGNVIN